MDHLPAQTIELSRYGRTWAALLGHDPQTGVRGFGPTPAQALRELAERLEAEHWQPISGPVPLIADAESNPDDTRPKH